MRLADFGMNKVKAGEVGIEIEVEFTDNPYLLSESEVWTSKKEDSLRFKGVEYITVNPIEVNPAKLTKLKRLCDQINKKPVIKDSPRTSVHTHINVIKYSPLQIATGICAFWSVENVLARYCGEDRESNLFCLRLKDAEGLLDCVIKSLDSYPPFYNLGDNVRYSSLNLAAIRKFGSVEVRLKGGSTDAEDIDEWTTEMHSLFKYAASSFTDPEDFFTKWQNNRCAFVLDSLFGAKFRNKLKEIPNYRSLMEENAPLISELAFTKDWPKWEKALEEKLARGKPKKIPHYDDVELDAPSPQPINYWTNSVILGGTISNV